MDIRRAIGRNLRRLRLERRLSQEALAFEADIDRAYMGALERGVRNPTVLLLERLAVVLHVPVSTIVSKTVSSASTPKNLPRGRHVGQKLRRRKSPPARLRS